MRFLSLTVVLLLVTCCTWKESETKVYNNKLHKAVICKSNLSTIEAVFKQKSDFKQGFVTAEFFPLDIHGPLRVAVLDLPVVVHRSESTQFLFSRKDREGDGFAALVYGEFKGNTDYVVKSLDLKIDNKAGHYSKAIFDNRGECAQQIYLKKRTDDSFALGCGWCALE